MSNALLIGLALAVVAALVLLLRRKTPQDKPAGARNTTTASSSREVLLQIVIPATGACCAAARQLENQRFHKGHAPALPLAECSMKTGCHCRYQPQQDRRLGDRRQGEEKRETIRFEENPRRDGRGRRAVDRMWEQD